MTLGIGFSEICAEKTGTALWNQILPWANCSRDCLLKNAFDYPLGKSDHDLPTFKDAPALFHAVQSFLLQHYISKRVVLK